MPNYITNNIAVKGDKSQIEALRELMNTDESDFDFNSIVKMPETIKNISAGSMENEAIAYYKAKVCNDFEDMQKMVDNYGYKNKDTDTVEKMLLSYDQKANAEELLKLGQLYVYNLKRYGATTWYDWSIKNWGTKWNSMDASFDGYGGSFSTAWDGVTTLIQKLSEKFPDLIFEYEYADEDFGSNLGRMTIQGGVILKFYFPENGTEEAYDLAADIFGYDDRENWDDDDDEVF